MFKKVFIFLFVLVLVGQAWAGLVGYWQLNGDGTDLSDFGNNGTVNGNAAVTLDQFADPNGAMYFPGGGGDNVNVGDAPEFNMSGAMTITAWVYLDSTNALYGARNGRIIGKMGGGGRRAWSTGIEKNVAGVDFPATFQVCSDGNTVISLSDDASLPSDQWVHYAAVYVPGASMTIYLDGTVATSLTSGVPATQYSTNGRSALIGNRPDASDCGWTGALDEVRIYNEALSAQQVQTVMGLTVAAQRESHNPNPGVRATNVPVNATLSWDTGLDQSNPTSPNPAITGHNLWISAPYDAANPPAGPDWQDAQVQIIELPADTNPADGSVDPNASYNVTLQMDKVYFWIVDESVGASGPRDWDNIIAGSQWSFETITSAPIVDAGSNVVTWLKDGSTTVDLNGVVTDATGDVTSTTWSVLDSPQDSTADIANASTPVTTVTVDTLGHYELELRALDAAGHNEADTMTIDVYADSCEAARNNPAGYNRPAYDFNNDCKVDFTDFAMFTEGWLADESLTEDALY